MSTRGWITGLHLGALFLLNHDDPAGFIVTFNGSYHCVAAYLLDKVLSRHSQASRDFLLQTSLLEQLSVSLGDAVRVQNDSQAQLSFLEQANLFLVFLDNELRWYRYHHLFVEVLCQRLQQTSLTLVPDLHRRASRWYEQQGLCAEALSHALAAPALQKVACLIKQCTWTFIVGSQLQSLRTHSLQKNHPGITPFGYWLVSAWSVMLLRGIILTLRFPGLFRRVLDVHACLVNRAMRIVAAERLPPWSVTAICRTARLFRLPRTYEATPAPAAAVAWAAMDTGEARLNVGAQIVQCYCRDFIYVRNQGLSPCANETARKEIRHES